MSDRPEWNSWILQKNAESKAEELKKSDSVVLEKAKIIDMKSRKTLADLPSLDSGKTPKRGLMGAGNLSHKDFKVKFSPKHSNKYHNTYTVHHEGKQVGMYHHEPNGDIHGGFKPEHEKHHEAMATAVEQHVKKFPRPIGSMAKTDGEDQDE